MYTGESDVFFQLLPKTNSRTTLLLTTGTFWEMGSHHVKLNHVGFFLIIKAL